MKIRICQPENKNPFSFRTNEKGFATREETLAFWPFSFDDRTNFASANRMGAVDSWFSARPEICPHHPLCEITPILVFAVDRVAAEIVIERQPLHDAENEIRLSLLRGFRPHPALWSRARVIEPELHCSSPFYLIFKVPNSTCYIVSYQYNLSSSSSRDPCFSF